MELKWKVHKWDFNPTAAQLIDTDTVEYCVMDVHRGTLVAYVAMRVGVKFSAGSPKASVGINGTEDGFIPWSVANITSAGLKNGTGSLLCIESPGMGEAANGKLFESDDTIELFYTGDAATTTGGALSVIVVYAEIE